MGYRKQRKGKKFSSYYKKGFRDAYNNPSQYKDINLSKAVSPKAEEFKAGAVSGYLKAQKDRQNNIYSNIWSDKDLGEKIE